jgi:hypothetical protein
LYAGQKLTRKQLMTDYDKKNSRNPFVDRNWRDALTLLENNGRVSCNPPMSKRRPYKGAPSFGENVLVAFPKKEKK